MNGANDRTGWALAALGLVPYVIPVVVFEIVSVSLAVTCNPKGLSVKCCPENTFKDLQNWF